MGERRGRILQSSIEQVLQRSDLGDLAAAYTQLRKAGGELQGRCPFHDERTPSFWVNPTKGVYHCFGCGASGDTITFAQEKLGLDFVEAIEYLAERYRVELEYEEGTGRAERRVSKRRLYELTDAAASYYEAFLWRSSGAGHARAYLAERHVSEETARAFRMGYAPEDNSLQRKAAQKGFTPEELVDARLVKSERKRDFFQGRLMVPIVDRANRVLGFGARKLREDQFGGKYVNSADGPLFHKKQTVFIAPGIRQAAEQAGEVLVVEGYMDVIALWQAGWKNACAVMGTALTEEQVLELKRLAPRALFAFDPDAAGQVATLRALEQARKVDLDVRVVLLTDGDPADVVMGPDGRERMAEILSESVSLLHYRVSALLGSDDTSTEGGRERVWKAGLEFFATVPESPERQRQVDRFAFGLGLDSSAVQRLQGAAAPATAGPSRSTHQVVRAPARLSSAARLERRFLAVADRVRESSPDRLSGVALADDHFSLRVHARVWELLRGATADGADPLDQAHVRDDEELSRVVAEIRMPTEDERVAGWSSSLADADVVFDELALRVEEQHVDRQLHEARDRMRSAADGDDAAAADYSRLVRRRRELEAALAEAGAGA